MAVDQFRTAPDRAVVHPSGWHQIADGIEVLRVPLLDGDARLADGRPMFARLSHNDELEVLRLFGAEMMTIDVARAVWNGGLRLKPVQLVTKPEHQNFMQGRGFCETHDARVWDQLEAAGWDGLVPVANVGKFWVKPSGANARNCGWFKPDGTLTQPGGSGSEHHDRDYADYSQLGYIWRRVGDGGFWRKLTDAFSGLVGGAGSAALAPVEKSGTGLHATIRLGSRGDDVRIWQGVVGVDADGVFGPATELATRAWQRARGLVADGVVGAKTWLAAGYAPAPVVVHVGSDPRSPACIAALRDANARWPDRRKTSDGIMGDARHQASKSDHNQGLAVDISHDPTSGCVGQVLAEIAIRDERVTYVIFNGRIYNRSRAVEGWRVYTGSNPHKSHVHISVRADRRNDDSPWGWAPGR